MKAEDVDAELVEIAEAAREDALRKWHIKFRAGQQTEPGHVLGMRAALAAVLPDVRKEAWNEGFNAAVDAGEPANVWLAEWDDITNPYAATTEEPTT